METSINIVSTFDGKKKQKSMTNINPSATNEELSAVGQMINALSKNNYVETIRINKQNVLEPSPTVTLNVDTSNQGQMFNKSDDVAETRITNIEGGVRIERINPNVPSPDVEPEVYGYIDVTYAIE